MATKAEMVEAVADAADMSKADTERAITAFFEYVTGEMQKGESVQVPRFGKFSTSARAARTGRNPQTGAPVQIAASTAAKFTASSALKEALNGKKK